MLGKLAENPLTVFFLTVVPSSPGLPKGGVASTGNKSDPSQSASKADAHSWRMFFNFEVDSDDDLFNPFLRNPLPHLSRHHGNKGGLKPQGGAEVHELLVSLEDILTGVTKRVKVTRLRQTDKHTVRPEERVFDVEVQKGWKEGTKITFPKEGHQLQGHAPNDLVFVIKEKKHAQFRRDGSHVVYTSVITLREVRCVRVFMCVRYEMFPRSLRDSISLCREQLLNLASRPRSLGSRSHTLPLPSRITTSSSASSHTHSVILSSCSPPSSF